MKRSEYPAIPKLTENLIEQTASINRSIILYPIAVASCLIVGVATATALIIKFF